MTSQPGGVPTCYRHPGRETWISCQRCGKPICPDCMREAAVGYQCPDCVRQGAKDTRTGVLPYGGQRSRDPRLTTYVLIALNAFVWLLISATGGGKSVWLERLGLLPSGQCTLGDGRYYPGVAESTCGSALAPGYWIHGVADGALWQPLTSMFTHVAVLHIGSNMLALFFIGPMLETLLGRARFLAVYFASGLLGSATVMLFADDRTQTVGASGAIFGLMGALVLVGLKVGGNISSILTWVGLNLVLTFTISGISWQGHIGGLVGGVLLGAAIVYAPRNRRALLQWATVAVVLIAAVALIAVRATSLAA